MLYLGYFTFPESRSDTRESRHGYFSCVVDADAIDDAMEKFEVLIRGLKRDDDLLDGVDQIYVDICVELLSVPATGLLANWASWDGVETTFISRSLPGVPASMALAYDDRPDDVPDDAVVGVDPFIDFSDE